MNKYIKFKLFDHKNSFRFYKQNFKWNIFKTTKTKIKKIASPSSLKVCLFSNWKDNIKEIKNKKNKIIITKLKICFNLKHINDEKIP